MPKNTSKRIDSTENSDARRWRLPSVGSNMSGDPDRPLTASELEAIQKQAYDEGFSRGQTDGLIAGKAEADALQRTLNTQKSQLTNLLHTFARPLEDLDEEVIQQLIQLATAVARQIIRRELHIDPGQVVAVVREALQVLPLSTQDVRIFLHPEDVTLIRDTLSLSDEIDRPWRIVDDPVMCRGDCRIEAGSSFIDASVDKRLNQIVMSLVGGERENDASSD